MPRKPGRGFKRGPLAGPLIPSPPHKSLTLSHSQTPKMSDTKDIELAHLEEEQTGIAKNDDSVLEKGEEAARILKAAGGGIEYTLADSKRILRRIDIFVCVPMCLTYLLQQLDKSSVSYGAVFDLQKETGLVGTQYSWLTSIVYVAQLICQPLSSYALVAFPVRYWVTFNMASWAIVTACTSAARNFTGLIICRLFLGMFEATILPSFVFITQMWWTRREQSYRMIAVQVANSGAVFIGPLLSYAVGHINKGLLPYQAIFLFLGCLCLAAVPYVFWSLPNSPADARFLKTEEDRLIAIERLRENNTGIKSNKWRWDHVREVFQDPKSYMWAAMYFCTSCPSGGIGAFGGLITKGFGFDTFTTILMQMPTGAIGIITLLTGIYFTNRFLRRWIVILCIVIPPIAGATAMSLVGRDKPGVLIACYYVIWVYGGIQPLLYTWANSNAGGTTKRVVTFAFMFALQCTGNIIGPQVYLTREAPYYHTGLYVDVGCWSCLCCLIIAMRFYLAYLNRKQEAKRVAMGLPANLKDMSILSHEEADVYRRELSVLLAQHGMTEAKLFEDAFEDLTDRQNPMFMYVL
nr:allantoate transporter [Naematelia aurantialba]